MDSYQVFSYAHKSLPKGTLAGIYKRSSNLIYGWAAPPTNEHQKRNPIDRITIMLKELKMAGRADVSRAAIDIMAAPLGGCFTPLPGTKSDKGHLDGEAADAAVAMGRFIDTCRESIADGRIDKREMGTILEELRTVRQELDQMYDVIQDKEKWIRNENL